MGAKINEYSIERFTFGDDDYYDIDYWDGSTYQTAKIKGITIKNALSGGGVDASIYSGDGTLVGNRILDGANYELFFQELGKLVVHSHANNTDNIEFEVRTQASNKSFNIKDHNTGFSLFSVENGKVKINGTYNLPSLDGAVNRSIKTDGAGQWGYGVIQDDGTTVGINSTPINSVALNVEDNGERTALRGYTNSVQSNAGISSLGVHGVSFASQNSTNASNNIGVQGVASNHEDINIGVQGTVTGTSGTSKNVGVQGVAANGSENYCFTGQDGTQSTGRVLQCQNNTGDANWVESANLQQKDQIHVACSDETTVLAVTNNVLTFRAPYQCILEEVRMSLTTAGTGGGNTEIDVTLNGTTIFSTRPTIASGSLTSVGGTAPVLSVAGFSDDDEIKINITSITNEPTETGLKVLFKVKRS